MAARRPTVLILVEAQSRAGPEGPPFLDYTCHVVLPPDGKRGAGFDVYVRSGTPPEPLYFGAMRTLMPSS